MNMITIFTSILNMSITASYCIVAILILRLFLKKQSKIFSYLLWSVVLFRMLCPVSVASSFSLVRIDTNVVSQADFTQYHAAGNDVNVDMAGTLAQNMDTPSETVEMLTVTETDDGMTLRTRILKAGAWIWFAGVVLLIGYGIWTVYRLKHFLKKSVHMESNIYEAEGIASPFVFGVMRPCIYLPPELASGERRYVLEHERVHIARKDYLVKILAWLARCIHWFNPLAWLFFALMERDMEMSCDEAVLRKFGMEAKQDYSRALLALSCDKSKIGGCPTAFGEGGTKERIRNILAYRKRAFATVILITVLSVVIVLGLSVNPVKRDNGRIGEGGEAVSSGEAFQFVTDYVNAWCSRDGNLLVSFYINEDIAFESLPMLEKTEDGYLFGYSSPWPYASQFLITNAERAGHVSDDRKADIWYYAWTSDPHVSVWKEEIFFIMTDEGYRVTDSSLMYLDSISSLEEYEQAYRIDGEYRFIDYVEDGFVETINVQTEYDRENGESDRNVVYRNPDTAAEWIFNLSGGRCEVSYNSKGQSVVEYTFADGGSVMIPMMDANFNGLTQNGGDDMAADAFMPPVNAEVWIPDLAVWNAGAP